MGEGLHPSLECPVRARVRRALVALALARASEALLVGAGALILCLAALVAGGAALRGAQPWAAALLCAAFAAAAWWAEHRPRPEAVALRIDRRLGFDGALVTAFESEASLRHGELAGALSRRVAGALPLRVALRAALPPSLAVAAFPLAALAVFALVRGRVAEPADTRSAAVLGGIALGEIGEFAEHLLADPAALEAAERAELLELVSRARTLALSPDSPEAREFLAQAALELERLARELPLDRDAARARLERAEEAAEAALGRGSEPAAARPEPPAGGAGSDEPRVGEGAALAPGRAGGTMSALDPGPTEPAGGAGAAPVDPSGGEAGLVGASWWSARDEDLVRRWVEARRAQASAR